ncbi:uncharacterized protein LOC110372578 isoform X1 [Helicoverpa armigera]|uniref:uncharacterized protein LOC110372578 isoform X1 n=1 Tax=Helicoverpa armigera TaxID=29058 RepID=UPI003082AF1E
MFFPELRRSRARSSSLRSMNIVHWILVYMFIINVVVFAGGSRGGGGGGSRGGGGSHGLGGSRGSSLSGSRSSLSSGSRVLLYGKSFGGSFRTYDQGHQESHEESHAHEPPSYSHSTKRLTHFDYHPPDIISFTCRNCSSSELYPVYNDKLPSYVFACKESFCKYRELLAGLSLYNLARTTVFIGEYSRLYMPRSNERCSLQIVELVEPSHVEETEFPCFMISTFLKPETMSQIDNSDSIDVTSLQIDVSPFLEDFYYFALEVTDQECVVSHDNNELFHVPCKLLMKYANTVTEYGVPAYFWFPALVACIIGACVAYCRYAECKAKKNKKKEVVQEDVPLNGLVAPE